MVKAVLALGAKIIFVPSQIAVITALVVAHIAILGFFAYAIGFFFNKYNDILQYVADMSNSTGTLALIMQFLQAIGFINAFNDVFSLFSPFLIAFLTFKASKMIYDSFKSASNELFKLGVLVQE